MILVDILEEWKAREPGDIACVVVGKNEIQEVINEILGIKSKEKVAK